MGHFIAESHLVNLKRPTVSIARTGRIPLNEIGIAASIVSKGKKMRVSPQTQRRKKAHVARINSERGLDWIAFRNFFGDEVISAIDGFG